MLSTAMVLGGLASAMDIYIFVLESLVRDRPATRKSLDVGSDAQAATTEALVYSTGVSTACPCPSCSRWPRVFFLAG